MKRKNNPELLKEEIKKYKLLSEYNFYQETQELPTYMADSLEEADEEPSDLKPEDEIGTEPVDQEVPAAAKDIANDLGVSLDDEPMEEPTDDNDVEVDVTSIVNSTEEAKKSADMANEKSEMLLKKLSELEAMVNNIGQMTTKIDDLEKELIKRNPTPVEKLEMRSLSSYPFNQKLSDYWAEKEGPYDVMGKEKKKEYILTKKDIDSDYSDKQIEKSFSVKDNPYDEETIQDYDEEDI